MKYLGILLLLSLVMGCSSSPKRYDAAPVNVMVIVDESSSSSLPADHRATRKLVNELSNALHDSGLAVYDSVILSLDDFGGNRFAPDKEQLIENVRSYRGAKIDYAIIISVEASVRDMSSSQRISTRIFGQTIDVYSGKVMGNFSDTGEKIRAPFSCDRPCLNDKLVDSVSDSAGVLAQTISAQLPSAKRYRYERRIRYEEDNDFRDVVDYVLVFEGFERREIKNIEDYLVIFSGYEDMQYSRSGHDYVEIWYQSSITQSKLSRNLNRMLDELNKEAVMQVEGTQVHIRKLSAAERKPKFDLDGWE